MKLAHRLAAILIAGLLFLGLARAGAAQQPRPRTLGVIAPNILSKLDLAVEQDGKIHAAEQAYQAEVAKLPTLSSVEQRRDVARAARDRYEAAVQAVLTPEQQKKLAALQQEARQLRALGPVGARLVGLSLTAEQKTKVRAVTDRYQPEMDRLRASYSTAADKPAVQTQMRDQNRKMLDEIKAVLTREQQKAFDAGLRKPKS